MPTAERVHPAPVGIIRILGGHVDMGPPEVSGDRRSCAAGVQGAGTPVPRRVRRPDIGRAERVAVDEGLVLDDQGDLSGGEGSGADKRQLRGILDEIPRGLAGIDIEARDSPCMVVEKHQPGALRVGPVERLRPGARVRHVGDVHHADPPGIGGGLSGWGDPLVGRAVADPRGASAVEMEGCPVFRERARHGGPRLLGHGVVVDLKISRSHDTGVDREKQVASGPRGQAVGELDAHRSVLLGDDQRSQVMRRQKIGVRRVGLPVTPQLGSACRGQHFIGVVERGEVGMHPLAILDQLDFVVIRSRKRRRVRDGNRNALPEIVRGSTPQRCQGIYEFPQRRAVGPIGGFIIIRRRAGAGHRARMNRVDLPGEGSQCQRHDEETHQDSDTFPMHSLSPPRQIIAPAERTYGQRDDRAVNG